MIRTNSDRVEKWGAKAKEFAGFWIKEIQNGRPESERQFVTALAILLDEASEAGRRELANQLRTLLSEGEHD